MKLVAWYEENHTIFPWRKTHNPYKIWISEIMLQQTQVKTVIPYYLNWMNKMPTIYSLYNSDLNKILKLWEGLGYYYRAQNIHKASKKIVEKFNGEIPTSYNSLITLNGIGNYTASAILSIAYNQKFLALDGNLKRVLSRYFALSKNKQKESIYNEYGLQLISKREPGKSNQALMDIGREICKSGKALCHLCPLQLTCQAYQSDTIEQYPIKNKPKTIPLYNVVVGLIIKNNKFLISKRKPTGLLPNLWELPGGKIKKDESKTTCLKREIKEETNIIIQDGKNVGYINHAYSHFKVKISLFIITKFTGHPKALASVQIKWVELNEINKYTFPRATHKLFELYKKNVSKHI